MSDERARVSETQHSAFSDDDAKLYRLIMRVLETNVKAVCKGSLNNVFPMALISASWSTFRIINLISCLGNRTVTISVTRVLSVQLLGRTGYIFQPFYID